MGNIRTGILLAGCLFVGSAFAEETCNQAAYVQIDESTMTLSPKTVTVCQGGTVTWESAGPTRFQVIFPGQRAGPERRASDLVVTVDAQSPPGDYPYLVQIRGQELDPTIIIR